MGILFTGRPLSAVENEPQDFKKRLSARNLQIYSEEEVVEEIALGQEIAARVLGRFPLHPDPAVQNYINLVGRSVALNCSRPELDFYFGVVKSEEREAFSIPGGYVLIPTGALRLMESEAELAGVMAREIIHVAGRHLLRDLNDDPEETISSSLAALFGWTTSRGGGSFQDADKALHRVLERKFKKEETDFQADRGAVFLATLAGYDPTGLVNFLERIGRLETLEGPGGRTLKRRILLLRNTIREEGILHLKLAEKRERFARAMGGIKSGGPGIHFRTGNEGE